MESCDQFREGANALHSCFDFSVKIEVVSESSLAQLLSPTAKTRNKQDHLTHALATTHCAYCSSHFPESLTRHFAVTRTFQPPDQKSPDINGMPGRPQPTHPFPAPDHGMNTYQSPPAITRALSALLHAPPPSISPSKTLGIHLVCGEVCIKACACCLPSCQAPKEISPLLFSKPSSLELLASLATSLSESLQQQCWHNQPGTLLLICPAPLAFPGREQLAEAVRRALPAHFLG